MNAKWLKRQYRKIAKRIISIVGSQMYRDKDRDIDMSMLIAGVARSV
jgi:hypothetical protein